jgi:MFS family permease
MVAAAVPVAIAVTMSWYGMYTFVNAFVIRGLGRSNQEWTSATLWASGGMIFWYLASTEISSRLGRRLTVTFGLAATAAAYAIMAFWRDMLAVDLMLALMGYTTVANAAVWTSLVADANPDRPGRALALNVLVNTAVAFISLLIGGQLIAEGNYPRTFLVIAAACGASAIAFHILASPLEKVERTKVVRMLDVSRTDMAAIARGPFLIIIFLGVCMDPFSFHTMNQLLPNLARDMHGFTEAQTSMLVAIARVPAIVALFAVSRMIDRANIIRWYAIGLALDGVITILIGFASGKATLAMGYLAYYAAHGLVWGTSIPAVNLCLPERVRDSGFAATWLMEILAVFGVGVIQNRMLGAGAGLGATFAACGIVLSITGAALLMYSYTAHSHRTPN